MNKLRTFTEHFEGILCLIKGHTDQAVPEHDSKFAYAVIKAQMQMNKRLRVACLKDELTPELLESILADCGMSEWIHVVHSMKEEEDDFKQMQLMFREIAKIWH